MNINFKSWSWNWIRNHYDLMSRAYHIIKTRLEGSLVGDPCHIFEEYREYTHFSDFAAYQHIISTQVEDAAIMRLLAESRLGLI